MPNYKQVSKITNATRLFVYDKKYISRMVAELKSSDPKYATESTAIRTLVHIGIAAQTGSENLRNSLDDTIIRKSLEKTVRTELVLHTNHLEILENKIDALIAKNKSTFGDIANQTTRSERNLAAGIEAVGKTSASALRFTEEILRNLLVLRSMFYIFFLGYKTGRIKEDYIGKWIDVIRIAHAKGNELSIGEIEIASTSPVESKVVEDLTEKIFKEIYKMPKPESEPAPSNRQF